ncbi:YajG family lipoprotein [Vogesella amnigena]|uniref:YajG family lipoprotein n=1 Tax=Vogesella amnigena TaxID=1507449 RepID=A0ABV7TYE1_9NEIS
MRLMKSVVVSAVALAALSGCALTTEHVQLQYAPQAVVAPLAGAGSISVSVQVVDQRQDKKIGSKKNGFGMEMAPILAADDVSGTVRQALERELRARGFQLADAAAVVSIAADLTRFYNDFKMGVFAGDAVADLNLSITVKSRQGQLLYSRHLAAQGVETNIQLATGNNARIALNRALENGMKSLFEDRNFIAALLAAA